MIDEQVQSLLTADFEIGHYIRERIVPRAVLFFTGEALDDEDFEEEEGATADTASVANFGRFVKKCANSAQENFTA